MPILNQSKKYQSSIMGNLANYTVRYETIDNINYMVVPVTMMNPGVHSGSNGPALYTEEVLSDLPEQWNGRPVVILHPEEDGSLLSANSPTVIQQQAVGYLFNTKYDKGLKSEAYINTEKLEGLSKESLAALSSGQIMEVSIGGYETRSNEEGEWNGEKYASIVQSISSDHLALLPGLEGACSVSDGCGIRANAKGKEVLTVEEDNKGLLHSLIRSIRSFMVNENSDKDRRKMIESALKEISGKEEYPWVMEVYPEYVIYELSTEGGHKLYKRSYAINDDKATLGEEITEVKAKVEYVPVSNITGNSLPGVVPITTYEDMKKGESSMDKKQIIDYLVTNGSVTGYSEDNRESLVGMADCHLSKIHNMAEKLVGNSDSGADTIEPSKDPDPEPAPAKTVEQAAEPTGNSSAIPVAQLTTEQFMQIVPEEFKSAMTMVMNQSANQKTALITNIMKADPSFNKEELDGMSNNMLQKIFNSLSAASFVGNGGGPAPELNDNSKYTEMPKLWDNLPN